MPTKELYGLANEYRKTRLWEHLNDSELFAIQMPEGEIGYISILGALGTHIALAVYPGAEGLESLWKIWQGLEGLRAAERNERMLSQNCVMCSFDDKAELLPRDLNEIAAYGLNYRGKKAYPHFQRFRPLHHPWFVKDAYDEERLRIGLLAGIEVARKLNEVPLQLSLFQTPNQGTSKEALGLREGRPFGREIPLLTSQADGTFEWGRLMLPDYASPVFETPRFANEIARTKLNKKPKIGTWACSVFALLHPTAVDEEGDFEDLKNAPVYPLALAIIDHESELILHWGMTTPSENSTKELLTAFVDGLLKCGVPNQIFVRDARTEALLLDVTKQLGILLKRVDDLPQLDAMEEKLLHMPEVNNERETVPELLQMLDSLDVEKMSGSVKEKLEEMLEHQWIQGEAAEKVRNILEKAAKPRKVQAKITPIDRKTKPIQGGRKAKQTRNYVISVSLGKGCYRHIRVSGNRTLKDLHEMILDAFDFVDDHAHAFFMDNRVWSGKADYYSDLIDEAERSTSDFKLDKLSLTAGKPFKYVFDFGDEWRFQCKVLRFTEGEEEEEGVIKMVGTAPPQYESEGSWDDGDSDDPDTADGEPVHFPEIYAPSKLKKLYGELPLSEETVQLLHNYFSAVANLYGLVSLRKTLEIYNAQNESLSEDQFAAFAEIVRHERHLYFVMGADELIDEAEPVGPMDWEIIEESLLLDDVDDYLDMKEQQAGKPFYVPPKGELLKYADDLYYEKTPQFYALKNYLEHQMHCKNADELADELQLMASTGEADMGFVMDDMARMGLTFSEIDDFQRFLNLYTDMSNHSRIHYNRGHTPEELSEMSSDVDKFRSIRLGPNISNALRSGEMDLVDMRKAIWEMEFPNQELKASYLSELDRIEREKRSMKSGRNDPCPCGSGKKYKHCCGKNS